jgi:3-mercaptopyruvate sulfurtransferase SseA
MVGLFYTVLLVNFISNCDKLAAFESPQNEPPEVPPYNPNAFFYNNPNLYNIKTSQNVVELENPSVNINRNSASTTKQNVNTITNASIPNEPKIQWVKSNDFMELISYLAEQSKFTPKKNYIIIDTRNSNEYNGWKSFTKMSTRNNNDQMNPGLIALYDQKNGHIAQSHNFDADWLSFFDPKALNSLVASRVGLSVKENEKKQPVDTESVEKLTVVLYDTRRNRLERVKNYLIDNFVLDLVYLCQVETNDMSDYILKSNHSGNLFFQEPFYDMLLSADVLFNILKPFSNDANKVIDVRPIAPYKLIDVGQGGPEKYYDRSHIPTAVHLDTNNLEDPKTGLHRNRSELAKLFLEYGIPPNNTEMVILYGNPNPLAAYRCALLMKWLGVRNIHVLNGGFRAWLTKYPIEMYANRREPYMKHAMAANIRAYEEQSYAAQAPINYIVDQTYVADLVKNSDVFAQEYMLVDVRSLAEYMGESSGYSGSSDKKVKKGRIPSSVWGKGGSSAGQLEDYRNPDLTMRSGVEILRMWDELGIDYRYKHLIFYCSDGWRSSEVMYYAELMGLYRISLYSGGWIDWSSNPINSIESSAKATTSSLAVKPSSEASSESATNVTKKIQSVVPSTITVVTHITPSSNTVKYYNNNMVETEVSTSTNEANTSLSSTHSSSQSTKASSSSSGSSGYAPTVIISNNNKPSKFAITTNKTHIYTNKDPYRSNTSSSSALCVLSFGVKFMTLWFLSVFSTFLLAQ